MTRSLYLERIEYPYMHPDMRQTRRRGREQMRHDAARMVTVVLARSFGSTLAHIGLGLGLTKERVRQIEKLAHHHARRGWTNLRHGPPRGA